MHEKTRCGECDQCIEHELFYLSSIESALWLRSAGDASRYLNLMGSWIDLFNEQGLPW